MMADMVRRALAILLVAGTTTLTGCSGQLLSAEPSPSPRQPTTDAKAANELADAQGRWAANPLRNYSLIVTQTCLCLDNATVQVKFTNGVAGTPSVISGNAEAHVPTTVEELLQVIAKAHNREGKVSATYDKYGIPATIDLDPIANAIDDETTYAVAVIT